MSLTTSEELQKQLTIIFGFSKDDTQVGEIIGVGKLTKEKINELVYDVLRFFNAYNGMLRDYAGTEIYAIEFDLKNYLSKKEDLKILPQSMVVIPGEYKDCNTLLLALTQESSLLNVHKARASIDRLGELFFQVDEVVDRPELNKNEITQVLSNFTNRFSLRLQGEIIEGKWNKKLVGIDKQALSQRNTFNKVSSIRSGYSINWHRIDRDIQVTKPRFKEISKNYSDFDYFEYLKRHITEPSVFYIVKHTLKLSANLLRIANIGSIDEVQEGIIRVYVNEIWAILKEQTKLVQFEEFIEFFKNALKNTFDLFSDYDSAIQSYCKSGDITDLDQIKNILKDRLTNLTPKDTETIDHSLEIQNKIINQTIFRNQKSIKSIEFKSCIDYFTQTVKIAQKIINSNFQRFLCYKYLFILYRKYFRSLIAELNTEEKPARTLGTKFLKHVSEKLKNSIYKFIINQTDDLTFDREILNNKFSEMVKIIINKEIDEIDIKINDLMSFAEIMLGSQAENAKKHLDKLKHVEGEFTYLSSFILRYSSLNRFIQSIDYGEGMDPASLSKKFREFLWKRIGGLNIHWKDFIFTIIDEFNSKYQPKYEKDLMDEKPWSKYKIIKTFISFISEKILDYIDPENFVNVLDWYIAQIKHPTEQALMVLFFEQYEYSLSILKDFPTYMKQKMLKKLGEVDFQIKPLRILDFLKAPFIKIPEFVENSSLTNTKQSNVMEMDFFEFLDELELMYFSKLIARPSKVILRSTEMHTKGKDLYYHLDFSFWENFFKVDMSNNWNKLKHVENT